MRSERIPLNTPLLAAGFFIRITIPTHRHTLPKTGRQFLRRAQSGQCLSAGGLIVNDPRTYK
jgi:hypothetical protein